MLIVHCTVRSSKKRTDNDTDTRSTAERERDRQEQHRRVCLAIDHGLLLVLKYAAGPMNAYDTIGRLFHLCVFHHHHHHHQVSSVGLSHA